MLELRKKLNIGRTDDRNDLAHLSDASKNQTTDGRANCVKKCDAPAITQKWPVVSQMRRSTQHCLRAKTNQRPSVSHTSHVI